MRGEGEMRDSWASVTIGKEEFWLVEPQKWEKRELAYSAFVVKDIKKTIAGLRKKAVDFHPAEKMGEETKIEGPIAYSPWGATAFFDDSEGNLLMLWQNTQQ